MLFIFIFYFFLGKSLELGLGEEGVGCRTFPPLLRIYLWRYHKFKVLQVLVGAIMTLGTDCEELLLIFSGAQLWVIALQLTNSQLVLLTPPLPFYSFSSPPPRILETRRKISVCVSRCQEVQ